MLKKALVTDTIKLYILYTILALDSVKIQNPRETVSDFSGQIFTPALTYIAQRPLLAEHLKCQLDMNFRAHSQTGSSSFLSKQGQS